MRERLEQILKIVCLVLAVLLVVQLAKAVMHMNPLAGVVVPDMPSLPADTNAPVKMAGNGPMKPGMSVTGTNGIVGTNISKTNTSLASKNTNSVTPIVAKENAAPVPIADESTTTNNIKKHKALTNNAPVELAVTNLVETNSGVIELSGTNVFSPIVARSAWVVAGQI